MGPESPDIQGSSHSRPGPPLQSWVRPLDSLLWEQSHPETDTSVPAVLRETRPECLFWIWISRPSVQPTRTLPCYSPSDPAHGKGVRSRGMLWP